MIFGERIYMQLIITAPHALSVDEVKQRLENSEILEEASDMDYTWNCSSAVFTCSIYGLEISGTVSIESAKVTATAEIPDLAAMFMDIDTKKAEAEQRLAESLR